MQVDTQEPQMFPAANNHVQQLIEDFLDKNEKSTQISGERVEDLRAAIEELKDAGEPRS